MNLKVEKNAGNKIMIKSYENDNGYESCRRVWKYNCCKKKQNIHIQSCGRMWLELI